MGARSGGGVGAGMGRTSGMTIVKSTDSFGRPQYHSPIAKGAKSIGANQLLKNWEAASKARK